MVDAVCHLHEHRCHGTFGNYAASVKLACELEGKSTAVFDHPLLPRTKLAIKKRLLLAPRKPTWVGRTLLERMVPMMIERPFMMEMLVLLLAASVFLLRVPPEGMPMSTQATAGLPTREGDNSVQSASRRQRGRAVVP